MQASMGWNYYIHFIKRLLSIVLNPPITRLFVFFLYALKANVVNEYRNISEKADCCLILRPPTNQLYNYPSRLCHCIFPCTNRSDVREVLTGI